MEEELQESNGLPDFAEIKGIIRRRRWQFLVPFFCGWVLVWGASWLIPSTYRSGTLILVEQPSVPEKYVVSNIDSDIQQQLDSITQQILSRTRLLRIIDSSRSLRSGAEAQEPGRSGRDYAQGHRDRTVSRRRQEALRLQYLLRESRSEDGAGRRQPSSRTCSSRRIWSSGSNARRTRPTSLKISSIRRAQNSRNKKRKCACSKISIWANCPPRPKAISRYLSGLQNQVQANQDSLNRAKQQSTYLESLINQYRAMDSGAKPGERRTSRAGRD